MAEVQVFICAGRCGKEIPVSDIESSGWSRLEIIGKYRCGDCDRTLERMSSLPGAPSRNDIDSLKPDDIGALKKLPEQKKLHEKPR